MLERNELRLVSQNEEKDEKLRESRKLFAQLGLVDGSENPEMGITAQQIARAKTRYASWKKNMINMSDLSLGDPDTEPPHVESDDIEPNFNISALFKGWSEKARGTEGDSSLLFCKLDDVMAPQLLRQGEWNFKGASNCVIFAN